MVAISCHSTLRLSRPLIVGSYSDARAPVFCCWLSSLRLGPQSLCDLHLPSTWVGIQGFSSSQVYKWSRSPNSIRRFNYTFCYWAISVHISTLPTLYMLSSHSSFCILDSQGNKIIPLSQSYK